MPSTTDLNGLPYTPAKARSWLSLAHRADLARQFDCQPEQVEFCLDRRETMDRYIEARVDYELGRRELDVTLSELAREHDEGRVGSTPIAVVDDCRAQSEVVEAA